MTAKIECTAEIQQEITDWIADGKTFRWHGRVDIGCEIEVQGRRHLVKDAGGSGTQERGATFSDPLPDSKVPVSVEKLEGRGRVAIVQTPDSTNGYTAVIQIEDTKSGSDDYELELRWPRQGN